MNSTRGISMQRWPTMYFRIPLPLRPYRSARAAVSSAEQLQQAGLRVALIVTFDPVVKTVVPNNVHLLKNFYLSSGVGTTVERGGKFHGVLQNVDMGRTEFGHISLTTAPPVQKQVLRDIFAANSGCR